jgi:hypothetical protein
LGAATFFSNPAGDRAMAEQGRNVLAVVAGVVLWSVLWVGGAQVAALMGAGDVAGQSVTRTGALLGYIAFSVVLSVLAGYTTASAAGGSRMRAVHIAAGVLLLLGIGFEVSAWHLTPVWYHLVFLVLLVPAVVYGGRLRDSAAAQSRGAGA